MKQTLASGVHKVRRRIVRAAEELFAVDGFERVSVRAITGRAGVNVAAVNYYFGSRDGLVKEVVERWVVPVVRERAARLGELERRGGGSVEELVEAFVRPFVTQVRRSEMTERLFGKLMGRMFGDLGDWLPESVAVEYGEVLERFVRALRRLLPGLAVEDLYWRVAMMAGAMVHGLGHGEALWKVTGGRCGDPGVERLLAHCVRFVSAGMRAGVEVGDDSGPRSSGPQQEFGF